MEEYLENIGTFYDEKVKFLSKKDNLLKCKDCELDKQFIEEHDKITLIINIIHIVSMCCKSCKSCSV